jgi:hypothetical protein
MMTVLVLSEQLTANLVTPGTRYGRLLRLILRLNWGRPSGKSKALKIQGSN